MKVFPGKKLAGLPHRCYNGHMKVVICGGGGFIGQHLAKHLLDRGHEIVILDRNRSRITSPSLQSVVVDLLDTRRFEQNWFAGVDAVVNLSGKDILHFWSQEYKKAIWESRVAVNRGLIGFISGLEEKPGAFISASAVGYYGDKGDSKVDESAAPGTGFLAEVCVAWENEARRAETLGMRSVQIRTAPVLNRNGGIMGQLLKSFKFGFAVQFGAGRYWFPWIHMQDLVRIYETAVTDAAISGPVNASAPEPVRFHDFLDHLRRYHKAVILPVPVPLIRIIAQELISELTNSQRIVPKKLNEMKFGFSCGKLDEALRAVFA